MFGLGLGIGAIAVLLISWIIDSFPVWLSAKFFSNHDSYPRAMLATLAGVVVFGILAGAFGLISPLLGLIIGFIGLLAVFKAIFEVGWGGAFAIAIISFIIIIIIGAILGLLFGISLGAFSLIR